MAIATSLDRDLSSLLRRRPDSAWLREGLALFGWGTQTRIDPGVGPDRYMRAREVAAAADSIVFASFTFDEDQPGSVLILPDITLQVDAWGNEFIEGDQSMLPIERDFVDLPLSDSTESDATGWGEGVATAMRAIERGSVEKVVLSRAVDIDFWSPVSAHTLLERLASAQPSSHIYLIEGLVGSSPELLIQLRSGAIRSVSLAGSADRTLPGSIDTLSSPKMATEHVLAADSVEGALLLHSSNLTRKASEVATFGDIHHLATSFASTALPGTAVTDLLGSLHPTAAVAGTPTDKALEMIREIERHDRGRYAGPIGWLDGSGDGEFAIALRCGLVSGSSVRLYAGAGLVEGSRPDDEFEETEIKLKPMLQALGLA